MKRNLKLHVILFVITVITTTIAGAVLAGKSRINPDFFLSGLPFSLTLLSILGVHETGHFLASRYHRVEATLPYFIPAPPPPFFLIGTFGALIKIKSPIYNRKALFDIGFAGPATGFLLAIPLLFFGLSISRIEVSGPAIDGVLRLGDSLILTLASRAVFGRIPEGYELMLHPVAFAAWIGLWVTAINLLPVGQLDGGHISYAIFGEKYLYISRIVFIILVLMGLLWLGWILWGFILLFFLKLNHPPPVDPYTPLGIRRKILGIVAVLIFVMTFIPVPFII
ncbi:site-2 protease family protein [bacterium]|nr:site-2 protease family protein [bacterium]